MKSLRAQVGVRVASEAVLALRGLILLPVLARTLGVEGYGAFTQIWLTAQVLTPFISLSVENAVVQRVASGTGARERAGALGHALVISAALAATSIAIGLTPLGPSLAKATMGDSRMLPELLAALVLAGLGGPIAIGLGYLQGLQRITMSSTFQVCRSFASTAIMVVMALAGASLRWVIVSAVAADAAFVAVLFAAIRPGLARPSISMREVRWMASFALPFAAGNALYLALNALPRFFLVNAHGLAAVAVFSATLTLASPLLQVAGAVQFVIYPAATRQSQRDGIDAAASLVARSATAVACFASFALVGLCFLGPPVLAALSGGRLAGTAREFAAIGYGMSFLGLYRVVVIYQVMAGRSKALLAPLTAGAGIVAIASVVFVSHAGAIGASLAFLLACASLLAFASWQLRGSNLAAAVKALSPIPVRAAIALAVPLPSLFLPPAATLPAALAYAALGLVIVLSAWLAFGGAAQFRQALAAREAA
jgi:O-antigen/teichoic acid export membrane protein